MSRVRIVQAAVAVLLGGLLQGDRGALIVLVVVAALALAKTVWDLEPPRRQPLVAAGEVQTAARFPGYDRLYSAVLLSKSSSRHVDLTLRPVVQKVLAAEIEDLGEAAVRARVGEDVWRLVDPGRLPSSDSSSGGLDRQAMQVLLDRLEQR